MSFVFPGTFGMTILPFLLINGRRLFEHWLPNIYNGHKFEAIQKFGQIPSSPWFSYLRILWMYSPLFVIVFLAIIIWFLYRYFIHKERSFSSRIILLCLGVIFLHSMLIDLLPFTKLGRSQFPIYPITVLVFALLASEFFRTYVVKSRQCSFVLCLLFAIFAFGQLNWTKLMIQSKVESYKELHALVGVHTPVYLLRDDPHSPFISKWLGEDRVSIVDGVQNIVPSQEIFYILIGPYGEKSGMSIMRHSVLPDFAFSEKNLSSGQMQVLEKKTLPYYSYLPPFLMEEEVSQAFYFVGKSPDFQLERFQLHLFKIRPINKGAE